MDLQADESKLIERLVRLRVVNHRLAIDPRADPAALAANEVIIPILLLERLFDSLGFGFHQDLVPARFIVKRAPPAFAGVALVTDHFVGRVFRRLAAQLHASVYEPAGWSSDELD